MTQGGPQRARRTMWFGNNTSFPANQLTSIGGPALYLHITIAWIGCFGLLRRQYVTNSFAVAVLSLLPGLPATSMGGSHRCEALARCAYHR